MMPSSKTQDLARQLLSVEAVRGNDSEPTQFVALRVCNKLRQPLSALAGVAGYRALLSRALRLATAEAPWLSAVQLTADGSLEGLAAVAPPIDEDAAREGGVILLTHLLGLFLGFIGTELTLRMVQEVAPDLEVTPQSVAPMPAETLLEEVSQLNNMSDRLDSLAEQHPFIEEPLMSISGNIRNTATTLEVLVLIRNTANRLPKNASEQAPPRYKM